MKEPKYTSEFLKEMQSLPLHRKVGITIARMTEFYEAMNGNVYVSFSGGKDSTVLLYIARKLFPDIRACFCDTGLEFPEIKDFVRTWDNVDIIRPDMSFRAVLEEYGYPVVSKEISQYVWEMRRYPNMTFHSRYLNAPDGEYEISKRCIRRAMSLLDAPFKISDMCCKVMKKKPLHEYGKMLAKTGGEAWSAYWHNGKRKHVETTGVVKERLQCR